MSTIQDLLGRGASSSRFQSTDNVRDVVSFIVDAADGFVAENALFLGGVRVEVRGFGGGAEICCFALKQSAGDGKDQVIIFYWGQMRMIRKSEIGHVEIWMTGEDKGR